MECLTIRGRELILPKLGGTSTWARGENLAAPWLHGPQVISHYPVGLGFPHPEGRYRPEGSTFSSSGCSCCRDVEGFLTRRMGNYPPQVWRDLNVGPRGNSRRALAPRAPVNHPLPSGVRVSTPCGEVSVSYTHLTLPTIYAV